MFKFKGISSEEMQVVIEEEEHFIAKAAQRYEVTEIEGRDDAIFDTQGYSYVERPILVQCLNINKIDDILAWLNGEGEFEYKGRKTVARFYSELEPRRESCIRIIDATFIRAPFWTKNNDDFILVKDRKDKETTSSSNITINDGAEARFKKLVVKGNSWQETSETGKNKFHFINQKTDSNYGINVEYKDSEFTLNGTTTQQGDIFSKDDEISENYAGAKIIGYFKAGTYNISSNLVSGDFNASNNSFAFYLRKRDNTAIKNGIVNKLTFDFSFELEEDTELMIKMYNNTAGVVFNNCKVQIQIEEGDSATKYEPFIPNKPSTEFESPIRNCGDNVNLINKLESGYYNQTTKEIESQSSQIYKSFAIDIDKGMYILSCNNQIHLLRGFTDYDNSNTVIFSGTKENITSFTIKITQKTKLYISVRRADNENWTEADLLKLEQGTKATPYSPYNCGNVNFKICNKNLLNLEDYTFSHCTKNEDGSVTCNMNDNYYSCINTSKLNKLLMKNLGKKITFSIDKVFSGRNITIVVFCKRSDSDLNYIALQVRNSKSVTIKLEETITEISSLELRWNSGSVISDTTTVVKDLMLTLSDVEETYQIKEEQSFSFPTKEGQVFHKGDYLADDGVHQTRETIELNGTEGWSTQNDAYNTENRILFAANLSSLIQDDKINKKGLCNYFVNSSISVQNAKVDITAFNFHPTSSKYIYFKIEKDKLLSPDVAGWKQWLANKKAEGKPLIVEYEIEEIIEPYSPEQQEVWEQIKNAKTYKGTTHIFSEDEISPEFEAIYFTETNEKIINEGNIESRPIIRLEKTVSNEVEITINNIRFKYDFKNDSYVEIDCQEKTVEYEGLNRNRQIKIGYDFPELKIKDNNIIMHEGDCLIKVKRKDRWL